MSDSYESAFDVAVSDLLNDLVGNKESNLMIRIFQSRYLVNEFWT